MSGQDAIFCRRSRGTLECGGSGDRTREGHTTIAVKRLLEILLKFLHFLESGLAHQAIWKRLDLA